MTRVRAVAARNTNAATVNEELCDSPKENLDFGCFSEKIRATPGSVTSKLFSSDCSRLSGRQSRLPLRERRRAARSAADGFPRLT